MDGETLEELLQGAIETPGFDIKAAMPWDCVKLAKHIIAMSNVRDGGAIVIGVDDSTFERTGVNEVDRSTYNEETMRDQMSNFADPGVYFHVSFPVGVDALVYVAIEIATFRDVPVICKKGSAKTRNGALYYRSLSRRVESTEISNSYDMRDLLNLAASRTATRNRQFGFVPEAVNDPLSGQLDAELGEL